MNCEDCKDVCCKNIDITPRWGKTKVFRKFRKDTVPPGSLLVLNGNAVFKRNKNLKWDCLMLHDGRCSIYPFRPDMCRNFYCKKHEKYQGEDAKISHDILKTFKIKQG